MRVAERRLAGATARVGVAMGDLFPKVTLVGEVGYSAPTFGEFGESQARFFSVGPEHLLGGLRPRPRTRRIGGPGGDRRGARAATRARCSNALEDTEGAMITYGRSQSRRDR